MIVAENDGSTHLLQSHDRGDSWQELDPGQKALASRIQQGGSSDLLQNLKVVTNDPSATGRIFLAANGPVVLVSRDDGRTWFDVSGWSDEFAAPEVSALAVNHAAQERTLFAGLSGAGLTGVWRHAVPQHLAFLPLVSK
jgi:photosystem II stability/assembly factor-like uncharacterized protein